MIHIALTIASFLFLTWVAYQVICLVLGPIYMLWIRSGEKRERIETEEIIRRSHLPKPPPIPDGY